MLHTHWPCLECKTTEREVEREKQRERNAQRTKYTQANTHKHTYTPWGRTPWTQTRRPPLLDKCQRANQPIRIFHESPRARAIPTSATSSREKRRDREGEGRDKKLGRQAQTRNKNAHMPGTVQVPRLERRDVAAEGAVVVTISTEVVMISAALRAVCRRRAAQVRGNVCFT